jgi:hypothetical protein
LTASTPKPGKTSSGDGYFFLLLGAAFFAAAFFAGAAFFATAFLVAAFLVAISLLDTKRRNKSILR